MKAEAMLQRSKKGSNRRQFFWIARPTLSLSPGTQSVYRNAGLKTRVQENTTCCYAVQDKVWVDDPDGNEWEVFVVLEADANRSKGETECCSPAQENSQSTACC